jgi:predicted O-methyltransferase YrrM
MSYWWHGGLERVPNETYLPDAREAALSVVNPGRRTSGTSVTLHELTCLLMAAHAVRARRVLAIGTFDGNTALNFAANLPADGLVVTVDLPPDFSAERPLGFDVGPGYRNLTPRSLVGEQLRGHRLGAKVRQVFGDSAELDFTALGVFDLAFIDGCHAYDYVRSDTEKVLGVLRPGGIVAWHDYGKYASVCQAVDEFKDDPRLDNLQAIEESRLAMGRVRTTCLLPDP